MQLDQDNVEGCARHAALNMGNGTTVTAHFELLQSLKTVQTLKRTFKTLISSALDL